MSGIAVESFVRQFAWLLLGAAAIGLVAQRLRVPYAVALVIAGLIVEESHVVRVPRLDPELVLFAFLPPLLFDAAFRLDAREVRLVARPVLLLAVPGVVVTAAVVGGTLALALDLPLAVALLFGSVVAATDPVAVTAVVKRLGLPARIVVVPEAESLVNDGMAITLYTALVGLAITGTADALGIVELFGLEVLGGVAIGAVLGFVFSRLTGTIDDHLIEMTISTVLAYGSYLLADSVHASGALACVAAGLIHGSYGRQIGMSAETSRLLDDLWEYLGFLANAILFLLVGFSVNVGRLLAEAWPVTVAVVAVLAARVLVVEGVGWLTAGGRLSSPPRERAVIVWSGLRGALTIALALGLPPSTPSRDLLIAMAFGVVLFTLVVQGLTLPLLIRRLGLARGDEGSGARGARTGAGRWGQAGVERDG